MTESPPKRRWPQFSLRTLLIVTAIIAVWLGWWSWHALCQKRVVDALLARGAEVEYGEGVDRRDVVPATLRWLVPPDFYANVTSIELRGFRSCDLKSLEELRQLNELVLVAERKDEREVFFPVELRQIANCSHLSYLCLNGWALKGQLRGLRSLTHLKTLELQDTDTEDSDLADLADLISLEKVSVKGTFVTENGVAALRANRPELKIDFDSFRD